MTKVTLVTGPQVD